MVVGGSDAQRDSARGELAMCLATRWWPRLWILVFWMLELGGRVKEGRGSTRTQHQEDEEDEEELWAFDDKGTL